MNREKQERFQEARLERWLIAILAVSVLARVAAAVYFGNKVTDLPGTADQVSYHTLALRVLGGHGLTFDKAWWPATPAGEQTAHWSYLYTGYLALVYALFGPNPLAARLIQAVLVGVLHPWLAYLLGKRLYGPLVGLATAALTAVYAYFIYYAANLMTEPFYITAILAGLYLTVRLAEPQEAAGAPGRTPWKLALALGLVLWVTVMLRQLYLLIIPFLFLWILLANRRRFVSLVAAGALVVLLVLPFTAFNYARFGRFVLLNTNAGFAFFWGNHPVYGTQFQPILPSGQYHDLIPDELLSLDEAALDQALLKEGMQFVFDDPGRYILLSISRIPAYFMFWPSPDSSTVSNLARVGSFGVLWPLMLYGLLLSMFRKPTPFSLRPATPALLLYLFIAVYTAMHLLTWALVRYRLPVDAALLVFAGLGAVDLLARVPALRRLARLAA